MTEAVAWVALAFSLLALGFSLCPRRVNEDPDGPAGTEPVRLNSIVTYGVDIPAAGEPEKDTTEVWGSGSRSLRWMLTRVRSS